jgi:hypothetical protein
LPFPILETVVLCPFERLTTAPVPPFGRLEKGTVDAVVPVEPTTIPGRLDPEEETEMVDPPTVAAGPFAEIVFPATTAFPPPIFVTVTDCPFAKVATAPLLPCGRAENGTVDDPEDDPDEPLLETTMPPDPTAMVWLPIVAAAPPALTVWLPTTTLPGPTLVAVIVWPEPVMTAPVPPPGN